MRVDAVRVDLTYDRKRTRVTHDDHTTHAFVVVLGGENKLTVRRVGAMAGEMLTFLRRKNSSHLHRRAVQLEGLSSRSASKEQHAIWIGWVDRAAVCSHRHASAENF